MTNKYYFKEFNQETKVLTVIDEINWGREFQIRQGMFVKPTWINKKFEVLNIELNTENEVEIEIFDADKIILNLDDIAVVIEEEFKQEVKSDKESNSQLDFKKLLQRKSKPDIKLEITGENRQTDNKDNNIADNSDINKRDNQVQSNQDKIIIINDRFLSALTNRLPKKNLFIELIESRLQPLKSMNKCENEYHIKLEEILVMIYDEIYN